MDLSAQRKKTICKMSALNSRFFTKKGRKYEVIATAYGDSKDGLDALLQYNGIVYGVVAT